MLDKGKEPVLGKLQTIQLVEANLQLLIWVFIRNRNKIEIEKDDCYSKFNFRLRKYFSIEEVLMKKRLIYNCSIVTQKPIIYVITDLTTYYDR